MKKALCTLLVLVLSLSIFSACKPSPAGGNTTAPQSSKPALSGEVVVYNWGEYINMDMLDAFEAETGIKVTYKTFPSNEYMYSNLQAGGYDVIIPSDYMISRLIQEDMLEKLDFGNIPNANLIDDKYKKLDYDPTGEYSVAYMWGTVGIIYNSALIDEELDSWSALWDEKYAGSVLQFDNPRDAVATALLYLGYSLNTTDEAQIREAFDLLDQQKPIIQKYVMDQIYDLLEGGEAAIGPYYAGDYLMMLENNEDLRFVIPKEGSNLFVDAMCIPKGAANKENAEAFINFMCRTDVCVSNMDETGYASPNYDAAEEYKEYYDLDDPDDFYQYNILYPSDEILSGCEAFTQLPEATNELYNDLWIALKS